MGGTPIGEKFKFVDFIDDSAVTHVPEQGPHVARDDQRARSMVELLGPLENFHRASASR